MTLRKYMFNCLKPKVKKKSSTLQKWAGEQNEKSEKTKEELPNVSYFTLFRYATVLDKVLIFISLSCSFICGAGQPIMLVLFGQVTGYIVDYASAIPNATNQTERDRLADKLYDDVEYFAIYTSVIGVLTLALTYISGVTLSYSAIRQITHIRRLFLHSMLNMDIEWHDLHQTGDFATSFTDNLAKIEEGIGEKVSLFVFYESTFVCGVVLALIMGWKLALVCLVSLPLSGIIMGVISWLSAKFAKQEMESYAAAGAIAEEVLSAIRTVVAFDGQKKETDRYNKHLVTARDNNIKRTSFNGISNGVLWFFVYACYALSFWYGVGLILDETSLLPEQRVYTPGNMVAVFFCTLIASWNFGQGAPFLETFGIAKGAAAKIFSVLDTEPKINHYKNIGNQPKDLNGQIEFKNVNFYYPSRSEVKVLRNLNLEIKSGETVALVGSSGCGKSTCLQLIQRFYDPSSGSVFIGGNDISHLNLLWLRKHIGVVGQEPALFATTIAENIRYGKVTATQDEIERAAKKANAHNFIKKLPHGYKTLIGERGAQLSGGQKQRIAIARALVRQPKILLLDEATSALDTTSEAEVQAALDSISHECTTVIVAHRLSTVRNAKKIVVLSQGEVVEQGSHSDLLNLKGAYYNLVKSHGLDTNEEENNPVITSEKIDLRKPSLKRGSTQIDEEQPEAVEESEDKSTVLEVIRENRPEWFYILLGCFASIVIGAGLPTYSVIFGDIIGVLSDHDHDFVRSQTNMFCLYFIILGIVTGIATYLQLYTFGLAGERLTMRLRKKMFAVMLEQEMGWFDRKENGVGALCAKLSSEAAYVQGASGMRLGTMLNSCSTFILANTLALYFHWKLALVLISFAPLILLSICFEQKIQASDAQTNQKSLESSAKIAVEAISNIRTIASLGCENIFYDIFVKEMVPYVNLAKKRLHFRSFVIGAARSLMQFAYAAGIGYGAKLMITENIDYGIVFKVSEAVIAGSWSIGTAFAFSPNFQKGLVSAGRIFKLLRRQPEVRNIPSPSTNIWQKGDIKFDDVYFSYPTRPNLSVLNGLNLSVLRGKSVALVGSSGCGKSTIIQLLERFYDPISGFVTVDDEDIKRMDLSTMRSKMGIVSQEPNLFDRTIAENIAYGDNKRNVSIDEIIEAAKSANIHGFISSLPLGYETRLGSKGTQLSGGQKQRVAIARALVRKPNLLLLDEATSALDNESEKVVQEALDNAKVGRTCITIAHRLTTIQDADLICVIKEGKLAEMGKHSELMEKKELYYEFYKLQSGRK